MDKWTKVKEWVNENAPMLAGAYQNKYVGMAYDRFASLPAKQQKQVLLGSLGSVVALVMGYLALSYLSLWSASSRAHEAYNMIQLLQQYQRDRRDKSTQIQSLDRNSQLAGPGQFKTHMMEQARMAAISPRMIQVEEKGGDDESEDGKGGHDVKMKQASITLERVNLSQLKAFLNGIEFGPYNLSISSMKITNDDKIRGYMKVELGVVAYLFQGEES